MTPLMSEEIRRIVSHFSPKEREIYAAMGGRIPASILQQPVVWWKPGDAVLVASPITKAMNAATVVKRPTRKPRREKFRRPILMAAGDLKPRKKGKAA